MKRYRIRITTACETALQDCVARNATQAWGMAFELAGRLLGEMPIRHSISVQSVAPKHQKMEAA